MHILVTQVTKDGPVKNVVNTDLVIRAAGMARATAEEKATLKATGANTYLKLEDGEALYIFEGLEWYWNTVKGS